MATSRNDVGSQDVRTTGRVEAVEQTDGNGTAIAALIVGLLAATFAFLVLAAPAAILFGLVAIVLGAMGMGKAKRFGGLHKGLAISGLVSGLLGLLLGALTVFGGIQLFNQAQDEAQSNPEVQERIDALEQQLQEVQGG